MARNFIDDIRSSYDALAPEYARRIFDELRHKPIDRELLERFAVRVRGRGEVCDLGCGPGQVARYLHDRGIATFGLDLSPRMVEIAAGLSPDLRFQAGDMLALNLPPRSLAGIAAFYAIVNLPEAALPLAFAEMARVLLPSGLLLLSFHVGREVISVGELWGQPIDMEFRFFEPATIRAGLEAAGFLVEEIRERDPYPEVEYPSRRAYVLARRLRA